MEETFSLQGRRALVTGGSRGIGAAICELFARHGARLAVLHYKDEANAEQLQRKLSADGHELHSFDCDVADEGQVCAAAAQVHQALAGIGIAANWAGIGGGKALSEIPINGWERMLDVHLRGTFLVTRAFFSGMVQRRWGRVINVASQLAYKGAPGLVHYCSAKAGIVGFTRALSYEGAPHNVMVNAIAPGWVQTALLMGLSDDWRAMKQAQLPVGRFGQVEEIAPTALLLASQAGAFYCGQTLSPNGGDVML